MVHPSPGESMRAVGLRFVWRQAAGASGATYRVTVVEADGAPLWTHTTADTTVVVPDSVSGTLVRGRAYRWYVETVDDDGTSIHSGSAPFTVVQ